MSAAAAVPGTPDTIAIEHDTWERTLRVVVFGVSLLRPPPLYDLTWDVIRITPARQQDKRAKERVIAA